MTRYFLHLAYDGSNFNGWQIQPEVSTVQARLTEVLRIFVKDLKGITGCGRTDTGVHARDYYAHFDTESSLPEELVYKLNAVLPKDIAIFDCIEVGEKRHARFHATSRTYQYHVHFRKNPFFNAYSTYHKSALNVEWMNQASKLLIGLQDFTSFSRSQTQTFTNLCDVQEAFWIEDGPHLIFQITANRFLRNMVRAIVGTLFLIGEGKLSPEAVTDILLAKDRNAAGKSAFPQGLFLHRIHYPFLHDTDHR